MRLIACLLAIGCAFDFQHTATATATATATVCPLTERLAALSEMHRVVNDPIKKAKEAREAKKLKAKKLKGKPKGTLASFFTGCAKSFGGVEARLDRVAAARSATCDTPLAPMSEHEQQQANLAAETAMRVERELASTRVINPFEQPLKRKRGLFQVPRAGLVPAGSARMALGARAVQPDLKLNTAKLKEKVVETTLVVTATGETKWVVVQRPAIDKTLGRIGERLAKGKSLAASMTKVRHKWNGSQKNEYVNLVYVYETPIKMLRALRREGHHLLPGKTSLYRWRKHYESKGPFSPLEEKELISRAITIGKMGPLGVDFDNAVGAYVKILLGLGIKGNPGLIVHAGRTLQKDPRFINDKKVQALTFSPGWVDGVTSRKNIVNRAGDKLKMNKFPPAEQIDATQTKYQDKHQRCEVLPELQVCL